MKKSKVILAIALAVILLVTVMNAPTFSWFSRPHNHDGDKIVLGGDNGTYSLKAYNGKNVTAVTKSSTTGVTAPTDSYTTTCSDEASFSAESTPIPTLNRKYFCTTITNSSGQDQNVSLYARTLSIPTASNGTLALGVNGPTRSYRDYSSLAAPSKKTTSNSMRIYFEKDNSVGGWNGTEFYICWNENSNLTSETLGSKGENGTYYKLTHVGGSNNPNQYYADIPKTATHAFFCVENWGTNNNGQPNWGQRSQELCNLAIDGQSQTTSRVFKITSAYKDNNSNSNHLVQSHSVTGNCIISYYSTIFVAVGNTFNAKLASNEYIGGSVEYYSGNTSVFTVNKTTGVITPVAAGEATLYTKSVGGSYPDEQQVETTVKVTSEANYVFNDVPIVRNMLISGSTDNNANVVKVYWYVINNSTTASLKYKIDQVYIGL